MEPINPKILDQTLINWVKYTCQISLVYLKNKIKNTTRNRVSHQKGGAAGGRGCSVT